MSIKSQFLPRAAARSPIAALFPGSVVIRERRVAGEAADLLPSEAAFVKNAHAKRINEFAAGRWCARLALAEFGKGDVALHPAHDRQPNWPAGVVGSITHTTGLCAVAVAQTENVLAIGLDSELVGAPTSDVWPTICTDVERAWLGQSLPRLDRPAAVTLLFSAKEAFYKCQYPLTGEWLDFHDLTVEVRDWGADAGSFAVQPRRALKIGRYAPLPIEGRYVFHEEFVSAGVLIPAQSKASQ